MFFLLAKILELILVQCLRVYLLSGFGRTVLIMDCHSGEMTLTFSIIFDGVEISPWFYNLDESFSSGAW